ncbi:short-chain dehydrogenase [Luteitalea sp. TBR-22]|uniref:SDR family oxidoreductase n=1 Tax=Luteitalea sp. TBR-22 TaxID=2802971 RepID=UPI001AFC6E40|nr:SDR family oxidoreductase [Luteitalea sp. TBR-22]BCS30869.1 short-chain dehydrogenase [Luteitalea sp. TBR-22]
MSSPVLLITGGSRGIGAATARLAAARGYRVAFTYLERSATADALVTEIEAAGGTAIALQADVAREDDVLRVFAEVDRRFGRLTALVNNAGILEPQMRLDQMDVRRWTRVLATNVIGAFVCAREAVLRMSTLHGGTGGAIVNVGSMASLIGGAREYIDYAASKGALDSMTVGLAREVATEGIRVNGVRPGPIHTEIHASGGEPNRIERLKHFIPMQRGGHVEEVASAILWLLSDEASYVTGALLDVSGGR